MTRRKNCCFYGCRNDSDSVKKSYMEDVSFVPFPKPKTKLEKCKAWIKACGRLDFLTLERITRDRYVCSEHFVEGKGPTENYPNPMEYHPIKYMIDPRESEGVPSMSVAYTHTTSPPEKEIAHLMDNILSVIELTEFKDESEVVRVLNNFVDTLNEPIAGVLNICLKASEKIDVTNSNVYFTATTINQDKAMNTINTHNTCINYTSNEAWSSEFSDVSQTEEMVLMSREASYEASNQTWPNESMEVPQIENTAPISYEDPSQTDNQMEVELDLGSPTNVSQIGSNNPIVNVPEELIIITSIQDLFFEILEF